MSELRPFALVRAGDQWVRGRFDYTFLDYENGVVELAWKRTTRAGTTQSPAIGAGLAFDNECRLYHSIPDRGEVQRVRWSARDALTPNAFPSSAGRSATTLPYNSGIDTPKARAIRSMLQIEILRSPRSTELM